MKEFLVSIRYTAEELKQLAAAARPLGMSPAELIRARSLGKIVDTHGLCDWADRKLAKRKGKTKHSGS
jgi:hypothetical protein